MRRPTRNLTRSGLFCAVTLAFAAGGTGCDRRAVGQDPTDASGSSNRTDARVPPLQDAGLPLDANTDAQVGADAGSPLPFLEAMTLFDENSLSALTVTKDGNFVAAGYTQRLQGSPLCALWLVKATPEGSLLWTTSLAIGAYGYGPLQPERVIETSNHALVVVGWVPAEGLLSGGDDAFVMRFDSGGSLLWSRILGGEYFDGFTDVVEAPDGGLLLAGQTYSPPSPQASSIWLVRMSAQGEVLWQRTLEMDNSDEGPRVGRFPRGDYLVAGYTQSDFSDYGTVDAMLLRVTDAGDLIWVRRLGGPDTEGVVSIAGPLEENLLLGIYSSIGPSGHPRSWIMAVQPDGDIAWGATFAGPHESEYFMDGLRVVKDALLVAVGETSTSNNIRWIQLAAGQEQVEQWDGPVHPDYSSAWLASAAALDASRVAVSGWLAPTNPPPNTNARDALIGVVEPPGSSSSCGVFHGSAPPPTIEWHSPQSVPETGQWFDVDVPVLSCQVQVSVPTIVRRNLCQ